MSIPSNVFSQMERLSAVLDNEDMIEARIENDASGNPIYIGYCPIPNADPSLPIWYIVKMEYTSNIVVRRRLPINGLGFIYAWTARASFFP
jgi:hypothetical protein